MWEDSYWTSRTDGEVGDTGGETHEEVVENRTLQEEGGDPDHGRTGAPEPGLQRGVKHW